MAYLMAPQPPDRELPVFYNVDKVVGAAPAQNLKEDVLLVQYALSKIAESGELESPAAQAAVAAVKVTGVIDPTTITAIRLVQQACKSRNAGVVVDGRVSPARGGYSYGTGFWTIVHMNYYLRRADTDAWPRIDKLSGCPTDLQEMVVRKVGGA